MSLPILLLLFNRADHTSRLLETLRPMRPAKLYIHCDGPRAARPEDVEKVHAVRETVGQMIDWPCDVKTLYREQNAGLRMGVSGAVSWFFEHEPYGLILEDDCLPDASVLPFCLELLQRYENNPQVMHISCSNWAAASTRQSETSYLFSNTAYVTGWASWRRAWQHMSVDLAGLENEGNGDRLLSFLTSKMARRYLMDKFWVTYRKENNSWAYAWSYSILKNKGICITAKDHLIYNIGFGDSDASNTTGSDERGEMRAGAIQFPMVHPKDFSIDPAQEMRFFYASQKKRSRLWLWTLLKMFGLR